MPGGIDPTCPATGVAVSKAASRASRRAARAAIEHTAVPAIHALADASITTVAARLQRSRGAAELTELTGIAELELDDTIGWTASTDALATADGRSVRLRGGADYRLSHPLLSPSGSPEGGPGDLPRLVPTTSQAHDAIQLRPTVADARMSLRSLQINNGPRGVHSDASGNPGTRSHHASAFAGLEISGRALIGFFFENARAIDCHFRRIFTTTRRNRMRFRHYSMLNAAQSVNARGASCTARGFLFANSGTAPDTTVVVLIGLTAEHHNRAGIGLRGHHATRRGGRRIPRAAQRGRHGDGHACGRRGLPGVRRQSRGRDLGRLLTRLGHH